jgi:glycosyltransferase involved in cell wall biosynthesis
VNVLHISESDAGGGAGRAAHALHRGLDAAGHRSRMLVGRKLTADGDVRRLKRNAAWRAADRAAGTLLDAAGLQYLLYPSSFGVAADRWFRAADVVQLHNLHGSYFGFSALPALTRTRRPVVWLLHDQWGMTGHTAYSYECERWRDGCGSCPYLHEYPRLERDTTALLFRLKDAVYARSRLTLAAPSSWLARLASESPLLGRFRVRHIPNGIDLERFRPVAREEARRRFGLPPDAAVVLFSAPDVSDRRKGAAVLAEALARLEDEPFELVVVGGSEAPDFGRPARVLGRLADEEEIALSYAAADVFVLPTLADNLPTSAVESAACGTPTVSFRVGGVPDVVRHLETGYLAEPGDAAGLAEGIRALLRDADLRAALARRGREAAEAEFGIERQVGRYVELYEELRAA